MSSIEKLKITGIRSYSNVEPSIIEFYKPLTLIVGSNGAGKTSIIECLKYVTTGDMPPGSKNSYFVHDPKVAGEQEVKGQVKLLFTDITQKPVTVTRTLISTQKGKKTETRSLESVIKRDIQGERRGISSKCSEINHEMITNLGVSKAVLENVIFCHQEESNWPLSEGKVLKQKFDEIFAATRYIKALDAIRKLRQEKSKTVTMYETEMKYLKETKDKAQEITEELEKKEVKVQSTKDSIVKLTNSLIPVEKRLEEIDSVMQEVNDLTKEIYLLKSKKDHLYNMQHDLEGKISELFTGRTEELQRIYDEFQSKIGEKNNILQQKEDQHQRLVVEGQNLSKEQSRVSCEHGKLMQEAERHKKNLEERDVMVISLADHYTIPGYDNGPFEDTRVDSFVEELRKTYANIIEDTKQKKQMFHEKIQVVQAKIDDIKKTQAEYGETIRLKRNMVIDNQRELKTIGQELSNVDASANRLKSLETELVRTNKDLQEARDQGNVDDMNTEIDKLLIEKRQVDNELSRLRDEQQTMHMHSTTQAKLDMFIKDKHEKEDKIQKLMDKHEEDIKTYLGGTRTSESLIDKLRQYIRTKGKELSDTRNNLQRLKQALSAKNANKKNIEDQLTRKQEQANTYKQQLKEACGENDYNTIKEHMKTEIDNLRDDKSMYASIEGIYKKYIDKLQHESVRDEGCPLCHRCFDSSKDIKALVAELNKKINTLPEKRRDNERRLESGEKRYQKILNLGPIKENLEKLESTEIQESKTRLEVILADIESTETKITELEDIYSITESEELTAKQMEPDLRDVETLKQELKDLDRNISICQSKIHGIAPGRTMQAVTNEITDRQERSETLDRHIDRRRRALTQLQRQISTLESNLNDLKSQKLQLTERLQKRTHLENQKAELTAKNTTLEREIKDAEAKASPIQAMLIEEQNNKHEIDQAKEKMEDENRKMLNEIRTNGDKLRGKVDEIKRYISEGNDLELQDIERTLDNLTQRDKKLFEEKSKISATIDTLKNDISKQEIKARDLEDNIKLKSIQNDIQGVDRSIQTVHANLRQYGDQQSLDSERGNLFRESQNLRKEKAHLEGIQKGHEDAIRGFQADLRSNMYRDAEVKYRDKMIEMKTTQMATVDLDKYYKALDRAIMKYHGLKMAEINKIIKEYWINTYRGNDIDTIEIRSDEEEGSGASKARRTYNYRVVMIKGDTILDMRGRCSAGQKVLASLIIRLALAETFCLNCGILTLDEPTTNLDEDNVTSLADQLASVIRTRHGQKNFQLIVITHDEGFVDILGRADFVDYYYRIYKDDNGKSKILRQSVASLNRTESYIE